MSTSGVIAQIRQTAAYVSAELRQERYTQQARMDCKYHAEYIERGRVRIDALAKIDRLLREAAAITKELSP